MGFAETALWEKAFKSSANDSQKKAKSRLEFALLGMREKVESLVTFIPADCKGLTIHDISHLDAIWEIADEIVGPDWELNPAEAFVFGAAVLVHDAGLTTIAYPDGLPGLKRTPQWQDNYASRALDQVTPGREGGQGTAHEALEREVTFAVLRELHAGRALELVTQEWKLPNGSTVVLLDDSELRTAFGECIGRVAHSHHMDIEVVAAKLERKMGGSISLPSAWTVNEQKLACLLRCADAAQVDRTRAPSLIMAASAPSGVSALHWTAQNKLNRPVRKRDAILFSSGSAYLAVDAGAWWIAYDLAGVLDRELRNSNELLDEISCQQFEAQKVVGAGSPKVFARAVKTDGWRPLDASVRVSDPIKLAASLGGRHLYGTCQRL